MLEPVNEFSKVTGYIINAQNSVAFLYLSKKVRKRETKTLIKINLK